MAKVFVCTLVLIRGMDIGCLYYLGDTSFFFFFFFLLPLTALFTYLLLSCITLCCCFSV